MMKERKNLDLGNGLNVQATYDGAGNLTGSNGLATPAVSGWQATQDPRNQGNYGGDKLNTGLSTMERYNRYKDPYANDVRES